MAGIPLINERGSPMTPAGFTRMLERVSVEAGFGWKVHPHMLRHACGYKLADDARDTRAIQDHLGPRSIQSTVRYTELASVRFVGLWQDWVVGQFECNNVPGIP